MKKILTASTALTVAIISIGGMAYAATPPTQEGAPTEGSIIIHKYEGGYLGLPNNGQEQNIPASAKPLEGVQFIRNLVGAETQGNCVALDLTTNEGWAAASVAFNQDTNELNDGYCLVPDTRVEGRTDANGVINWAGIDLGAYYIEEGDSGQNIIIEKTLPFLATVPYPTSIIANEEVVNDWLYDVNVYPKNQIPRLLDKTYTHATTGNNAYTIDGFQTWDIDVHPIVFNEGEIETMIFEDVLDARMTYESVVVNAGETLVENTDYTNETEGNNVRLVFTKTGINKMQAANPATISISASLDSLEGEVMIANGKIANQAKMSYNGVEVPSNIIQSNWGELNIFKYGKDKATPLAGAEFTIYGPYSAEATECPSLEDATPVATATSTNTGLAIVEGVWVGTTNGDQDDTTNKYCLLETKAPVGFVASSEPELITVNVGSNDYEIQNNPVQAGWLPTTGAQGALILSIAGGAIIIGGIGFSLVRKSKKNA